MLRNFTGSSGVRAVIAVLMLLFVFACSTSDSGIKKQRDDAIAAAAAAEEARLAAEAAAAAAAAEAAAKEEAARLAAEEAAAAAAEAARLAAEEAAAKAEMDRLAKIDAATQAIAAATTAAEAQAAKDAVNDVATALEAVTLQAAVDARIAALATMASADAQRMALMTAAGAIDTSDLMTQQDVNAATMAINALKAALTAATDVSDADKAMYQGQVDAAETAVAAAQSSLDHAAQTAALTSAVMALQAIDLADLSTQEAIDAANTAITAVRDALDAATELSPSEKTAAMTELATADRTVMMAQGRFDTAAQKTALAEAVATLADLDLDNLMTQEQIDTALGAITALDRALAAATSLTDAEKLDATVDMTVAKRKVDRAETTLAANIGSQRMALNMAGTALAAIDLNDLSDQAKIDAANTAVKALKDALDGATHLSDTYKAMYQSQLDTATETVRVAETGMERDERMMAQRTAITKAVTMAKTAVAGVSDTSTDSEVASADAAVKAVKDAIADAADLSEDATEIISAQAVLSVIEPQLAAAKTSRTAAIAKADEDTGKANAAVGEAMHDALGGSETDNDDPLTNATASLAADLTITRAQNAGSFEDENAAPSPVNLKAGDSAGALGSWNGTNYAVSAGTGNNRVTNEARVYSNKGSGTSIPFAQGGHTIIDDDGPNDGMVLVVADNINNVMAPTFTHSGTQTHQIPTDTTVFKVRGTYDGAPGEYRCTGATACTSTNDNTGAPSDLGGTWHFKPDTGAMVSRPDSEYLYFGWWVSKDSDGMPTAATAFDGVVEGTEGDLARAWTGAWTPTTPQITGSASYAGNAVGKFAMNNPLDSTGNGGHFTADAMLEAKFSGTNPGVTGTIDNFRLNDGSEDPGWSVSLNDGAFGESGAFAPVDDTATADVDESMNNTVWSINDNKASASGTWSGTMYDEKPGDVSATGPGDGSNIPTTVTGTFYSEFSTIGRMVGAFGAEKQ